ncbi:hypothetical protein PanWU01x14_098490 [Parasponia andersonii]|uniref:Uncharacterized protein n=1 Tax=Parasponia andersonii TaxID=3476 RepID=A0A2P5D475_PARAD|nr:hypothetical protein PanWU01x14_098490 [Parasponia andersonii]
MAFRKPVTKYDLSKSSLIVFTTTARSTEPDPSLESSRATSEAPGFLGERKKEVAMPKSSEAFQAILSRAFSGLDPPSPSVAELVVGFSPAQRNL